MSADIYGVQPHVGRGGWSWYTGSASWMYRAAIESILGFNVHHDHLIIDPCIPKEWDQFQINYRKGTSSYAITVLNNQPEKSIEVDGQKLEGRKIPIQNDGKEHIVVIKI